MKSAIVHFSGLLFLAGLALTGHILLETYITQRRYEQNLIIKKRVERNLQIIQLIKEGRD